MWYAPFMENIAGLTAEDRQRLRDIAEPIYRDAVSGPFDMSLNDGWDVLEDDDRGDRPVFYISVRIDFANDIHWFTRFKLPDATEGPEPLFRADADKMALSLRTAALQKVVEILEIGPPGTTPMTLLEVDGALELCDAVRSALPPV